MVTQEAVEEQLKKIGFNRVMWGKTEIRELPNVILPDEEIYECVNGIYEGGFALLVATNVRVLLVDKKPMNYLNVEDLRFDMISEIDYGHRLVGATINISTGSKNLHFTSLNQPRLRKLIGHVQHCMAESKKKQSEHEEDQKLHLEQINRQLQAYLLAQHQQQQRLQEQLERAGERPVTTASPPLNPEVSDYLYAQSLLAQHGLEGLTAVPSADSSDQSAARTAKTEPAPPSPAINRVEMEPIARRQTTEELYNEGLQEVFGKKEPALVQAQPTGQPAGQSSQFNQPSTLQLTANAMYRVLDLSPLRIAYSRLPLAMRNRKFGRPSFHAHSQTKNPEELPVSSGSSRPAAAHS